MSDYSFEQIKQSVLEWSKTSLLQQISQNNCFEITKNVDEALIIDFTFEHCLAQIVVSNPSFCPYQYVSFEAMTFESKKANITGQPEVVCFFYDSVDLLKEMVLKELCFVVEFSSRYKPDILQEKYLGKQGNLVIDTNNLYHIIHPSDMEIYNEELLKYYFTCIDILSQYLVLEYNSKIFRVLPEAFSFI